MRSDAAIALLVSLWLHIGYLLQKSLWLYHIPFWNRNNVWYFSQSIALFIIIWLIFVIGLWKLYYQWYILHFLELIISPHSIESAKSMLSCNDQKLSRIFCTFLGNTCGQTFFTQLILDLFWNIVLFFTWNSFFLESKVRSHNIPTEYRNA